MRKLLILLVLCGLVNAKIDVVLLRKINEGITVVLKEKYGQNRVIKNANLVIIKDGIYMVKREL